MEFKYNITRERIQNEVVNAELIGMSEKNLRATFSVLAKFIIGDDGNYLPFDEAYNLLVSAKVGETQRLQEEFWPAFTKVLVNPTNGTA